MKHLLGLALLSLLLTACGGEPKEQSPNDKASSKANTASKASSLSAYLSEQSICDLVSPAQLQKLFATDQSIETRASSFRDNFSCAYSWDRLDRAEREQAMLSNIMASVKGDGTKLSMRERALSHEVTIGLTKSRATAESFVPRKLTQEELDAQVKRAQERAAERLTDEQKAIAGDAANDMMARLLEKNNQNETISGVGDAAFWSNAFSGSLEVLDGDVKISITPLIADSKAEDLENAKQVAALILNK